MSLYTDLIEAGVEVDNHESDLYVLDCAEARRVIELHGRPFTQTLGRFRSNVDGRIWIDIPFAFDPFWEERA